MVDTVKMSSKGQIVIPLSVREELKAKEGTVFAVVSGQDTVILKKITLPDKKDLIKELTAIARDGKKRLKSKGIKEKDIVGIVAKRRRS